MSTFIGVDDAREYGGRVEVWDTHGLNRRIEGDDRGCAQITNQSMVLDAADTVTFNVDFLFNRVLLRLDHGGQAWRIGR